MESKEKKDLDYLEKLKTEIEKYECAIQSYRNSLQDTFHIAYNDSDDWKEIYDIRINIDSLDKLITGWQIEKKEATNVLKSNQKIISFIGNKAKGKTHIFKLLTSGNISKKSGATSMLNIKYQNGFTTFLDIPGGNTLNFLDAGSDEMKTEGLAFKFLEQFAIEVSDIIILVVGRMSVHEIQMIKLLKATLSNKTIIVIHNMTMIIDEEGYNDFQKTILQYGFDLNEVGYDIKHYIDIQRDRDDSNMIYHLILANFYSRYYQNNLNVISLIRNIIDFTLTMKEFDVVERLKWFIVDNCWKYFGQEINDSEISIADNSIKLDRKELVIKPFIAYFATDMVTRKIDLQYHYYYTKRAFVIQIELSNEIKNLYSNVQVIYDKYLFQISGMKEEEIPEEVKNDRNENDFVSIQFGEFLLKISVPISDGLLANTTPKSKYENGILELNYDLL